MAGSAAGEQSCTPTVPAQYTVRTVAAMKSTGITVLDLVRERDCPNKLPRISSPIGIRSAVGIALPAHTVGIPTGTRSARLSGFRGVIPRHSCSLTSKYTNKPSAPLGPRHSAADIQQISTEIRLFPEKTVFCRSSADFSQIF